MITNLTVDDLVAFEEDIASLFNDGKIRAPVHLESGNEVSLIKVFEDVRPEDWVLCSWRAHLKCLLKGVPPTVLKEAIMRGESMGLCFPEYRILSSAIVGGNLPIALGIAKALKLPEVRSNARVHCFLGDMTARTGIADECIRYSADLPIRWIVEDNGISVCTPTDDVWPTGYPQIKRYHYESIYPHAGAGVRVQF